jgi:hypothetical protein
MPYKIGYDTSYVILTFLHLFSFFRLPPNVSGCAKLLDGLGLGPSHVTAVGPSVPTRTRLPPPGFTTAPNHMNAFGLGIPRAPSNNSKNCSYVYCINFELVQVDFTRHFFCEVHMKFIYTSVGFMCTFRSILLHSLRGNK